MESGRTGLPRAAWLIAAAAIPLHVTLALATDLSPDEAYYLCAARHARGPLALVDHPPLVPALLWLGDHLRFLPVELRVRLWPIAFSFALTIGCVALALQRGASRADAVMTAWLVTFAVLPTAGGFVATPDGPALLAVTVTLLWATGTERRGAPEPSGTERPTWPSWASAAAAAFVGSVAKVIVGPLAGLHALEARGRTIASRVAVAAGALAAAPFVFTSLRFQLRHAFAPTEDVPWAALTALGALAAAAAAQALLWSPWVMVRGLRGLRALPRADRSTVLAMTGLVGVSALVRTVPPEPNWWAPAALVVVIAATKGAGEMARGTRLAMLATVLLPTAVASAHTIRPFLPIPAATDPTARLHGWSRGEEPVGAPGIGAYGLAAERCVYRSECDEIASYLDSRRPYGSSSHSRGSER